MDASAMAHKVASSPGQGMSVSKCVRVCVAVILMDYRRQVTGTVEQRRILFLAALALGGCGIW